MRQATLVLCIACIFSAESLIHDTMNAANSKATYHPFKDTTIKAVWRDDVYDPDIKGNVNIIMLNDSYFTGISDPEKAVIGYLASTIGNECYAETGGKQNVKCKILSALNLGYQCSETNKSFLKNWFKDETAIINQIDNCKPTLPTGSVEKTFDELKLTTKDDIIKVSLKGLILNIKENSVRRWSENYTFRLIDDKLTLVERTKD
jgi:hypothetical protein